MGFFGGNESAKPKQRAEGKKTKTETLVCMYNVCRKPEPNGALRGEGGRRWIALPAAEPHSPPSKIPLIGAMGEGSRA